MKREKDISYGQVGDRELKLDRYRPEGDASTHSAVILLHGGAWRMGDKSMMKPFGEQLAEHGFVALAPEYRLLGEAAWPSQLVDVKTAIRWARTNATELAIDPDKIALQGFSAGGHLALMAGGTPDRPAYPANGEMADISDKVAAVVAFFPPIQFTTDTPSPGVLAASGLLGESASKEAARKASPIFTVSADFPPTFLLHGTADRMVPHVTSQRMFHRLQEKGVPVELHLYPNHTHEFARLPSMLPTVQSEIALFLRRTMVDPDRYDRENRELNMFAKMEG